MAVDKFAVESTTITAKISAHYVDNARNLPWRVPPLRSSAGERPDPYHVWLSEVMLQQTTVAAVKSYFEAFTMRWPKVQDLALANEADVLAAWAGLGYYARARNLHKCARFVVEELDGRFPQNEAELLKLPGVGAYTAAAIAAIAFGERAVVVDANIERLVARLFAVDTPLPSGKLEIKQAMDKLTPQSGAGDFAQACMDIGASICTAKNPKCMLCPVQLECRALVEGDMERFPIKPPKKSKPVRKARFFWIERDGKLLLKPRPEKGMLAGMRALPSDDWAAKRDGHAKLPIEGKWTIRENIVQHSFTHFSLEVDMAVLEDDKIPINIGDNIWNDSIWWPLETITDAGLPTLFAKAVKWKLEELE